MSESWPRASGSWSATSHAEARVRGRWRAAGSGAVSDRAAERLPRAGDVHVGVRAGVPVWTDISTVSGEIRSSLTGAGEPEPGAEHLELRAKTVSGDVTILRAAEAPA